MKWCSVNHTASKPSSSLHSTCSSSRRMMSACSCPGGAWKKKTAPTRRSGVEAGEPLERRDQRGEILAPAAGGDGGRAELVRETRERQRDAEVLALLEHQLEVLQEQLELHLRRAAALGHEGLAHGRGPRAPHGRAP